MNTATSIPGQDWPLLMARSKKDTVQWKRAVKALAKMLGIVMCIAAIVLFWYFVVTAVIGMFAGTISILAGLGIIALCFIGVGPATAIGSGVYALGN